MVMSSLSSWLKPVRRGAQLRLERDSNLIIMHPRIDEIWQQTRSEREAMLRGVEGGGSYADPLLGDPSLNYPPRFLDQLITSQVIAAFFDGVFIRFQDFAVPALASRSDATGTVFSRNLNPSEITSTGIAIAVRAVRSPLVYVERAREEYLVHHDMKFLDKLDSRQDPIPECLSWICRYTWWPTSVVVCKACANGSFPHAAS
ncbi:hypothetical protein HD554DRAFT_2040023 [Boletus coccyginus]|nr:hypothetical protein HD554DRAFT_2040023 [Boletus coccyginus]